MKNKIFIYCVIIFLSACNIAVDEEKKGLAEQEVITEDIPKRIEDKPKKEEDLKILKPYGKRLYSLNELFIYENKAALKGKRLYDADADLIQLKEEEETEECEVNYNFTYNPLSLVGVYYSYESVEGGTLACGPPGSSMSVKTIHIGTLGTVKLTNLFQEKSIVDALKKDAWVKKEAKGQSINMDEINTFDDFLDKMNDFESGEFEESSFAVLDFSKETGLVAIRLIGSKYMGFNHSEYLQIGMWVKPKDIAMFKNKSYFYLDRFENGLYK